MADEVKWLYEKLCNEKFNLAEEKEDFKRWSDCMQDSIAEEFVDKMQEAEKGTQKIIVRNIMQLYPFSNILLQRVLLTIKHADGDAIEGLEAGGDILQSIQGILGEIKGNVKENTKRVKDYEDKFNAVSKELAEHKKALNTSAADVAAVNTDLIVKEDSNIANGIVTIQVDLRPFLTKAMQVALQEQMEEFKRIFADHVRQEKLAETGDELASKLATKEQELGEQKDAYAQLEGEKNALSTQLAVKEKELSQQKEAYTQLEGEKNALSAQLTAKEQDLSRQKDAYTKLDREKKTLSTELTAKEQDLSRQKDAYTKLDREKKTESTEHNRQVANLKEEYAKAMSTLETRQKAEVKKLEGEKAELKNKLTAKEQELRQQKEAYAQLDKEKKAENTAHKAKVEELEGKLAAKEKELSQQKANCAQLDREKKEENAKHNKQVTNLKAEYAEAVASLENTHEAEVTQLEREKGDLSATLREKENLLTQWSAPEEVYLPLLQALNECQTMESFVAEKGLSGVSIANITQLMLSIGKSGKFAEELYKNMLQVKKQDSKEFMTEEECRVYVCLNECYKRSCGKEFDLFVLPGKKPLSNYSDHFEKSAFDKKEMEHLPDKKITTLRYAVEVYVPLLISLETGNMSYKAQVKASN